mgnify:CR=1 FL=1
MEERIYNAKEELKRVDHLIYVSLKYTRTADILMSVVERMMNAYEWMIEGLLHQLKKEKAIDEIPTIPGLKADLVKKHFEDDKRITDAIDFFLFLRKVKNSKYAAAHEYRRNVTMTVVVEQEQYDITIDSVMGYYKEILDFVEYIQDKFDDER